MNLQKILYCLAIFLILHISYANAIRIWRVCIKGNDIQIFWEKASDTCNGFMEYEILGRVNQFSSFNSIAKITDINTNSYLHPGAKNISLNWNYFIIAKFNCNGNSYNLLSDTLKIDQDIPSAVEIDTVSINNDKLVIGWEKGTSPDTKGYIIYFVDASNNNIIIDTVLGQENSFFKDTISGNTKNNVVKYRIAVIDSCDNISQISREHNNLKLNISQDSCQNTIVLTWNYYTYWNSSDYEFTVFYRENAMANFNKLVKVAGNILNYTYYGAKDKTYYEFYIRAENRISSFTSSSNFTDITTNFVVNPTYIYLKNVTVNGDKIDISWSIDLPSDLSLYKIYRSEGVGPMTPITNVNYDGDLEYSYTDSDVSVNDFSFNYVIATYDHCNNEKKNTDISNSILLKVANEGTGFLLEWNQYKTWAGGVKSYTLFKKETGSSDWKTEAILNNTTIRYDENLDIQDVKGKSVCYYIQADEGDTNKYGYKENSTSNIVCIEGSPNIYVPSAIIPSGLNSTFLPVGELIDWKKSKLFIYDRWGELIWLENGISTGWSGKNQKNQDLQGGVYFYEVEIIGTDGNKSKYYGTVTLIR